MHTLTPIAHREQANLPSDNPYLALHVRPYIGPSQARGVYALRNVIVVYANGEVETHERPIRREDVLEILSFVQEEMDAGNRLVTWGGTYHDLAILAQETGQRARLRDICLHHTDIVHHIMCVTDVPLPLSLLGSVLGRDVDTRDPYDLARAIRDAAHRCEQEGVIEWEIGDKRAAVPLDGGWMNVETATTWGRQMRGYAPLPTWMR